MWYVEECGSGSYRIVYVAEPRHRDYKCQQGFATREEAYDAMMELYQEDARS